METAAAKRRLVAVLAADMVGYSRLMEADEEGTLARLKTHRVELIDPTIAKTRGRIIKTTGDGMLVEFRSVVDAVNCAVDVQRRMLRRNSDVSPDRRIEFRIGINIGDVIFDGDDIFGDGVNLAARLEQMAAPGGICVTQAVREQVGDKIDVAYDDLGEQEMKNIARPIRVFRIALTRGERQGGSLAAESLGGGGERVHRPAIVVLPFANMSGDPEQEFFTDGITEDIITELSRFRDLTVISRNSAFVFKGRPVNVREVAQEFGVDYVAEGSVRKAGDRIRVTVQLVDAASDQHVWAERYDRKLEDVFAIQDEVTSAIVSTMVGRVEAASQERVKRTATSNMAAYECLLAGKILHHRSTPADNIEAVRLLDRAIELDPKYAQAHAWRACTLGQSWVHKWCADCDATWDEVVASLKAALTLDDNDADVHRILAAVNLAHNDLDKAEYHQSRALKLNPNNDLIVVQNGEILTWLGDPDAGVEWINRAMRLNPYHPERYWSHLARAHFVGRRYGECISALKHIASPDALGHALFAAAYGHMGEKLAAKAHLDEARRIDPELSLGGMAATLHYKEESDREHHLKGLTLAGLT